VIASAVVPLFGGVGANLMLLCFVATGITLFTGWSWLTIVERIGAACTGSVSAIYHFPTTLGRWLTGGWRQPRYEGPDPLLEGAWVASIRKRMTKTPTAAGHATPRRRIALKDKS
jgi:S-DNA-T family DNA segregation ATPase FtsK/SpoIIIE